MTSLGDRDSSFALPMSFLVVYSRYSPQTDLSADTISPSVVVVLDSSSIFEG